MQRKDAVEGRFTALLNEMSSKMPDIERWRLSRGLTCCLVRPEPTAHLASLLANIVTNQYRRESDVRRACAHFQNRLNFTKSSLFRFSIAGRQSAPPAPAADGAGCLPPCSPDASETAADPSPPAGSASPRAQARWRDRAIRRPHLLPASADADRADRPYRDRWRQ